MDNTYLTTYKHIQSKITTERTLFRVQKRKIRQIVSIFEVQSITQTLCVFLSGTADEVFTTELSTYALWIVVL